MTAEKRGPIGICDQCGERIRRSDWYTSKGRPRLHCSPTCKATANSRAGAPIRSRKHRGLLARAIEKANVGGMAALTPAEHRAYLRWRRELRQARIDELRRYYNERYHRRQATLTPKERKAQRAKWREQNRRRSGK